MAVFGIEVAAVLGTDPHERSEERTNYRNGYRPHSLTTQVGDLGLLIPKLRSEGFLPSILERRRRIEAREDVLAFRHFLQQHWRKMSITNLLERANEAIKRQNRIVGISPNNAAITRLVGGVLLEQDEHWQQEGRRMFSAESMAAIPELDDIPALQTSSS